MRILSLGLASVLLLGACGASTAQEEESDLATLDEAPETTESASAADPEFNEADAEFAMAKYEACMGEHGIEIQAFGPGGAGLGEGVGDDPDAKDPAEFTEEDFAAANAECEPILEDAFGSFEMSPEQEAEMADQLLEMQKCMADKGFDIKVSGDSFEFTDDMASDGFDQAMGECSPDGMMLVGE